MKEDNTVYYDANIDKFYFKEAGLSEYLKEIYREKTCWLLKEYNYKFSEKIFISVTRNIDNRIIEFVEFKIRELIVKGRFYTYA